MRAEPGVFGIIVGNIIQVMGKGPLAEKLRRKIENAVSPGGGGYE
nr:hypothetical protein [Hyphobacterium sp. CCMP332]